MLLKKWCVPTVAAGMVLLARSVLASAFLAPIIDIDPVTYIGTGNSGTQQYLGFDESHSNAMIGWTFHLEQAVSIAAVGWYDQDGDGLSRPFQVGLWQDLSGGYFSDSYNPVQLLGTQNAGLMIPAGDAAARNGTWRVVNLSSPLELVPGDYELAGVDTATTTDVTKYVLEGPSNSQVAIRQFIWEGPSNGPGFHAVNNANFYLADGLELGPMLFTVPEPTSLSALGVIAGVALLRRRGSGVA